jgi:hypothetical protein
VSKGKKDITSEFLPMEAIERRILLVRGHKVMLDSHLAELYQVPTKRLNEAVRRNSARFRRFFYRNWVLHNGRYSPLEA